ncbi:class I SAM-dependent methyltransferase [Paenibacillus sp. GSMTC-2017]|uniref:class I SAM-dependent methyltransferase n=1 Tax=Paenibacillus sp. GSMTC-2017 TaxID=2794350 RepID=UPI0018D87BF1|nr:class I SAM-dependent methyltransferase [Paenibacillus sp. GSMTC-2017]MBH5318920.1 class I SAM-dependent methyltransferase [Paenibacillus sp. GSMTC-2017]
MTNILKELFDLGAKDYDIQRHSLIPCFNDFYSSAVTWTNVSTTTPAILDLGAGTGLLSAMMLNKFPDAKLTLIDFSEVMMEQAKSRLSDNNEVTYIVDDYITHPFDTKFDAIVSSLSIHHLSHEDKRVLFQNIYNNLVPGGIFVNADQALGTSPAIEKQFSVLWEQAVIASGLEQPLIEASKTRRKLDQSATLEDQLHWLRESGFSEVDCVYKHREFTVFVACKA